MTDLFPQLKEVRRQLDASYADREHWTRVNAESEAMDEDL